MSRQSLIRAGLLAVLLSLSGAGHIAALQEEGGQTAVATFEPGPCPQTTEPVPALETARCGFLVVLENRATPDGRTIRLPVAILPALSETPAGDPIVYMEGGPGGPGLPSAQVMIEAGLNRTHDVIVVGQRGTRYAEPALLCPEVDALLPLPLGITSNADATGQVYMEAARKCYERLSAQGIDLGAYNTTESAADFADLRLALGIAEWNVYGVSYGTDLALTYMREHPEGVRSVTIDSVVPPNLASLGLNWFNAGVTMDRFFAACSADLACNARYPAIDATFARLADELEAEPLRGSVVPVLMPGEEAPPGAKPVEVLIDGGVFTTWVFGVTELLGPMLPQLIDDMAHGRQDDVMASIAVANVAHAGELSWGLQYGVACSEWIPYETPENVLIEGRRSFPTFPTSVLAEAPQFPFFDDICGVWKVPQAPAEQREPTTGHIPTLVIAGSYDVVTSAETAAAAARPLTNATVITIPGVGHFVVPKSECAQEVMASFLANPTVPDTGCVPTLQAPPFTISSS